MLALITLLVIVIEVQHFVYNRLLPTELADAITHVLPVVTLITCVAVARYAREARNKVEGARQLLSVIEGRVPSQLTESIEQLPALHKELHRAVVEAIRRSERETTEALKFMADANNMLIVHPLATREEYQTAVKVAVTGRAEGTVHFLRVQTELGKRDEIEDFSRVIDVLCAWAEKPGHNAYCLVVDPERSGLVNDLRRCTQKFREKARLLSGLHLKEIHWHDHAPALSVLIIDEREVFVSLHSPRAVNPVSLHLQGPKAARFLKDVYWDAVDSRGHVHPDAQDSEPSAA